MSRPDRLTAAVVQAAPVLFDKDATIARLRHWTAEAGKQDAEVILFPEAYIPAYPRGLSFGVVVGSRTEAGRELFRRYHDNAVDVDGHDSAMAAMATAAKQASAYLCVGLIEKEGGTLYCTTVFFGPDGDYLGKHRKLKPTAQERVIWGEGDGSTLTVVDTPWGGMGSLICWENYMPLLRTAMYAQGMNLYLAPTADARESWQATMQHIARESGCFVLSCNQYVTKDMYPKALQAELANQPEIMSRGGSVILSPMGQTLAGPLINEEGVLVAELDLADITKARFDFDVLGHYARPDIFQLEVDASQQ